MGHNVESPLVDVSDIGLREIQDLDATVLGDVLRRFLDEAGGPQDAVAGFDSSLTGPPANATG
ncbi:FXSXX-COOH protein [Actinomadura sp. CNU-125]|nr:FXSXX-COOH protein [Actinomadura sp. CNU-125]